MTDRDPEKEAQYDREAQQIGDLFHRLHLDRVAKANSENVDAALVREIEATGKAIRNAIQNMDADWHDAMTAIERAGNAWEDKANDHPGGA